MCCFKKCCRVKRRGAAVGGWPERGPNTPPHHVWRAGAACRPGASTRRRRREVARPPPRIISLPLGAFPTAEPSHSQPHATLPTRISVHLELVVRGWVAGCGGGPRRPRFTESICSPRGPPTPRIMSRFLLAPATTTLHTDPHPTFCPRTPTTQTRRVNRAPFPFEAAGCEWERGSGTQPSTGGAGSGAPNSSSR